LLFAVLLDPGEGMRIGEALGLRHEDLGIAERQVMVTPRVNDNRARAKAGRSRVIPASAELMRLYADYPLVFTACRDAGADWVTYRRAPLPAPKGLPLVTTTTATADGEPVVLVYADEAVTIDEYGTARQITLFEHGAPALQILTSDTITCPVALLRTLKGPLADRERLQVRQRAPRHRCAGRLHRRHRNQHPPDRQPRPEGRQHHGEDPQG
jgi:hypothetical protein